MGRYRQEQRTTSRGCGGGFGFGNSLENLGPVEGLVGIVDLETLDVLCFEECAEVLE